MFITFPYFSLKLLTPTFQGIETFFSEPALPPRQPDEQVCDHNTVRLRSRRPSSRRLDRLWCRRLRSFAFTITYYEGSHSIATALVAVDWFICIVLA